MGTWFACPVPLDYISVFSVTLNPKYTDPPDKLSIWGLARRPKRYVPHDSSRVKTRGPTSVKRNIPSAFLEHYWILVRTFVHAAPARRVLFSNLYPLCHQAYDSTLPDFQCWIPRDLFNPLSILKIDWWLVLIITIVVIASSEMASTFSLGLRPIPLPLWAEMAKKIIS